MTPRANTKTGIAEVGEMRLWTVNVAVPPGWAVCDGRALNRYRYPAVYDALEGTTYGQPDSGDLLPKPHPDYFRIPFKAEFDYHGFKGHFCWIIYIGEPS